MLKTEKSTLKQIPRGVWVLGFVSMLMDISSEMIHSLLPLFLVGALGASALTIGIIEGVAEATALIVKVFSGVLSDYFGKRKWLAVLGYGMGALSKPFFALATSSGTVFAARFVDRIGKGIRGAPRDALIADITQPAIRGAAYGLRQAIDTFGAFVGPLLAVALMLLWSNDFRAIFWVASIPAVLAVLLLIVGVKEPEKPPGAKRVNPIQRANLARLSSAYWWVVVIGAVFMLARFSEAFLVLRAQQSGIALALVPLMLVAMNVVYSALAYPFGKLSDSFSQKHLLAIGLLVLVLADLVLACSTHWLVVLTGLMLWGVHMAMTQGLLAAMVANAAPPDLRGTAFGFFNLLSGIALLIASVTAGWIWQTAGAEWTFYVGAGLSVLALMVLVAAPTKNVDL
jgi:MFS family permease